MDRTIYLIGFMGSGKTFIGKSVSQKFELPFTDLDTKIERKLGLTIEIIFQKYSEKFFRNVESDLLLNNQYSGIVSCGGGVVELKKNRKLLQKQVTVWIDTPWELIYERIKNSNRPLVKTLNLTQLQNLYQKRIKYYNEASKFRIKSNFIMELSDIIISL